MKEVNKYGGRGKKGELKVDRCRTPRIIMLTPENNLPPFITIVFFVFIVKRKEVRKDRSYLSLIVILNN